VADGSSPMMGAQNLSRRERRMCEVTWIHRRTIREMSPALRLDLEQRAVRPLVGDLIPIKTSRAARQERHRHKTTVPTSFSTATTNNWFAALGFWQCSVPASGRRPGWTAAQEVVDESVTSAREGGGGAGLAATATEDGCSRVSRFGFLPDGQQALVAREWPELGRPQSCGMAPRDFRAARIPETGQREATSAAREHSVGAEPATRRGRDKAVAELTKLTPTGHRGRRSGPLR